jgi:hypothetical protein
MKDHEIALLVNDLADIARAYGQTQQLRERISQAVVAALKEPSEPVRWQVYDKCVLLGETYINPNLYFPTRGVEAQVVGVTTAWPGGYTTLKVEIEGLGVFDVAADEVRRL